jgi:hypothetical protein
MMEETMEKPSSTIPPVYAVGDVWTIRSRNWLLYGSVLMIVGVIMTTSGQYMAYWTELDWHWGLRWLGIVWIMAAWFNVIGLIMVLWAVFHRR